ncbi:lysyl-tRNA synthetase [uncultured Phycicoccus sp.]|uniref:lysyl-tRNA synthetase n=1 Tax=uncultured Phycicoccus sp. TaxID=661422 RepID=UPI00262C9FE9|nr:lysyl-tRNA synthetase [uncultured Phycicoccus sp.]
MDALLPYVAALVPTIVVAAFFYAIIKRMIEGDRRERLAQRRFEKGADGHENAGDNGPETPTADD